MSNEIYDVSQEVAKRSFCNKATYEKMYQESLQNNEAFWEKQAEMLTWFEKWKKVKNCSFDIPVHIKWYERGKLNLCYNCLDRHLPERKDQVAFLVLRGMTLRIFKTAFKRGF